MTKPVYRIALVGPAGVGKSTHAKLLQAAFGGDVLSFATPVKRLLRELFGDQMDDPVFARTAAQQFGTEFARKLDEDVWVRKLTAKVPTSRSVFVDDARFLNEYRALKEQGFTIVRLHASPLELERRRPTMTAAQWQHESELEQALFRQDVFVRTDMGSPEEVNAYLRTFLKPAHALV